MTRLKLFNIDRPLKEQKLSQVLNIEEVKALFWAVDNLKHKCMLMVIYSEGLRISELLNLKPKDIDSQRMQIFLRGAKGRKDRYTLLSEKH